MSWAKFRKQVNDSLDTGELRTLCFDLNIDFDSLKGEGKAGKVRELIIFSRRNNRVDELIAKMQELRPHLNWTEILEQRHLDEPIIKVNINDWRFTPAWRRLIVSGLILSLVTIVVILLFSGRSKIFNFSNNGENWADAQTAAIATTEQGSSETSEDSPENCHAAFFEGVPADRIFLIEVGENAKDVSFMQKDRESIELTQSYGMQLTEGGTTIGAFKFGIHNRFEFLKVLSLIDANCDPVELKFKDSFQDNDHFEINLQGKQYVLGINFQGDHIRFGFKRFD